MKFFKKSLKYYKVLLQYLIGHSQVALEQENKSFWILCECVRVLQTIALVLLYKHIIRILNPNLKFDQQSLTQEKLELICRIAMPTVLIQEYLTLEEIIYFQLVFLISLFLMLFINIASLHLEYTQFKLLKLQNTRLFTKVDGNSYQSLNLLNNTYNNRDFVEYFLLKQLMNNDNGSWIELWLLRTSILTNYFTYVLFLPQIYWVAIIFFRISNQTNISESQLLINFILNFLQLCFLIILEILSLYMQQSYRLKDTNYLRLKVTASFKIGQMLRIIPTLLYFCILYIMNPIDIYNHQQLQTVLTCFALLNLLFDLQDQSFNLPFVQRYKIYTFHLAFSIAFCITLFSLFNLSITDIITLTLIGIPGITKMLNQMTDFNFKKIMSYTLHSENVLHKQPKLYKKGSRNSVSKSFLFYEDAHQIEKQICLQRIQQAQIIKQTNYTYFLQFLRIYQLFKIETQQVLQTDEILNQEKSKFLLQCHILIKMHNRNCSNLYCFCRGFWGEKRIAIERNYQNKEMKVYKDFQCQGVFVSIDLINRYIRYYTKIILHIQIYKTQIDLTYISQLLSVICKSDEPLQSWLQVMEVKQQLQDLKKPYDITTLNLITSYSKYETLYRTQQHLIEQTIRKTILYEDYRSTEQQKNIYINQLFSSIEFKKEFLKKLGDQKLTYQSVQYLYIEAYQYQQNLLKKLQEFYDSSQCRTSCLLLMFFYQEVRCDYISFLKLKNILRKKVAKFFEAPISQGKILQNIAYIKVNLAIFTKHKCRGEILSRSENSYHFFGFKSKEEFCQEVVTVHQLVPPLISMVHDTIIELFLMTNRPNVLRQERCLIAQKANSEIVFIEMFLDFCFLITSYQFPVYCFMQEIKPIGQYENIRGHIIVDDYEMIQGMSALAYQSLFLDSAAELYNTEISKYYQDFSEHAHYLNSQMDSKTVRSKVKRMTASVQSQHVVQQKDANSVYQHYKIKLEEQLFILNEQDKFLIDITLTLAYGIVNGKLSKFYVIEFNKVQQMDVTEYIDSNGTDNDNASPTKSQVTQTLTIYDYQDNERRQSERSIQLHQYSFPQIPDHCVTNTQNYEQPLKGFEDQEPQTQQTRPDISRKSKFFTFKGIARKSDSDEEFKDQFSQSSNHKASATSQKLQQDMQKFFQKGIQYQEFSTSSNEKIIITMHAINALILGIIIVFLLLYQLKFRSQAYDLVPTVQNLQVFITTDYTDNIQLSLMYNKEILANTQDQDQYHTHLLRLLQNDAQTYLNYQKEYLSNLEIKSIFSTLQTNNNEDAWDAIFNILFNQLNFIQEQFMNQSEVNLTFVTLITEFPNHKSTYEEVNIEITQFVSDSITNFEDSQQILIIILIVISIIISLLLLFTYYNYFTYLKKMTRCSEQISFEALDSEIINCQNILIGKQRFCIYEQKMEFHSNFDQRQFQDAQSHFSSYKIINSQSQVKKQLHFNDRITFSRILEFLYPLLSLLIALIYLGIAYQSTINTMNTLQNNINSYNTVIQFQEQFSLMCFSSVLIENKDYLLNNSYINDEQIDSYNEFLTNALISVQNLSQYIRQNQEINIGMQSETLNNNICELFDTVDKNLCQNLDNGLLQQGVLESTQTYIIQYRNTFELNFTNNVDFSTSEDIIAINFIIKGITNYINNYRIAVENYIYQQIDNNMNIFALIFSVAIIFQILLSLFLSISLRLQLKYLKQFIYLLPRDTLYANDSFIKTLNYIQRHQNDFCQ